MQALSSKPAGTFVPSAQRGPSLEILIVDDDASTRLLCAQVAAEAGMLVHTADSGPAARAVLARHSVDLLLLGLDLRTGDAPALLENVRTHFPDTAIVVMTGCATLGSAVTAMRLGAGDFLTKPLEATELGEVLERVLQRRAFHTESRALRERLRAGNGTGPLVGRSPAMEKVYRILSKVAFTQHPVLVLGESGTGKELIARAIHNNGPNAQKPFVPIDCGAIAPTLMESELFGHVKGAFTGALRSKTGLLAAAEGGTVFLDEIGELPLDLQSRLLRALQEREVRPVGATHAVPISARVLAATNRDLVEMVAAGRFRKDLYFRLNVVNIRVPPLRDRKSDVPLLAINMLERLRDETGVPYQFADETLRLMSEYAWPGNVRELENAVQHACTLSSGPTLHPADFPTQLQDHFLHSERARNLPPQPQSTDRDASVTSIAEMEKQAILQAVHQAKGDKLMAARLLGIGKTTLYRKLKEYGAEEKSADNSGQASIRNGPGPDHR